MYTPLDLAKNLNIDLIPDRVHWKAILKRALSETDEILPWIWYDTDFLEKGYNGEFAYLNDTLLSDRSSLYQTMLALPRIPDDKDQDKAFSREAVSMFLVENTWAKHKEVYAFDAELEFAFADSDEIKLPVRVLDRLPYHCFYIEFAKEGIFTANFHGVFVNVTPYETGFIILFQRVKEDGRCMFGSVALVPEEKEGVFLFDPSSMSSEDGNDRNSDWKEFGFFILNAILYLCAENGEVQESQTTKKTYRPSPTVKNKFSEVRKWECGYRFGSEVRKKKLEIKKNEDSAPVNEKKSQLDVGKPRKFTPHTRRAHWHHYWTGPRGGKRTLILHWIPPLFIGDTAPEEAVIHRVRKS